MPAVYIPPGASSSYPAFQTSTHTDQIGVNAAPTTSTMYVETSAHNYIGVFSHCHIQQTDRDYAGGDTVRSQKGGLMSWVDLDNNDPSYVGVSVISCGVSSIMNVGVNGPSYGTPLAFNGQIYVKKVPTPHFNEYSIFFSCIIAGTYDAPISGGSYWYFDHGIQGPTGGQPNLLLGYSLVTNNYYNGSPTFGLAAGIALQSAPKSGAQAKYMCQGENINNPSATTYPWDIGYFVSGYSTGGTGDAYTNAIQVGGVCAGWNPTSYNGDNGQVGRGVTVKSKVVGTSVARLGAFVSEGTGEAGGLVFGLDINDANRASISRPSAGVMTLRGKVSFANGGYAASTTATPSNVVGKIAIYTDAGTLLGYLPIYGSL
jgi:hypothetical protein